jgi:putative endonuclease
MHKLIITFTSLLLINLNQFSMYCVYILRSKRTGKYYTGYTGDLVEKRLRYHNSGNTKSLQKHTPLEIVRIEEYTRKADAVYRERQIKSYKSGEAFKKLIK